MNNIIPQNTTTPQEHLSAIYGIFHAITNRVYVGSAVDLYKRWRRHKWELRNNHHGNEFLQRSWNKDGEFVFQFRILERVCRDELITREQFWIDKLQCADREFGYNILPFAHSGIGFKHSQETITQIQATRRKNGFTHSLESRRKIGEASKNRVISDETRKRCSIAHTVVMHTPESRLKMSASRIGKYVGANANNSKLTETQVLEIKLMLSEGVKQSIICKFVDMPSPCISNILYGKRYSNVKATDDIENKIKERIANNYYSARKSNRRFADETVRSILRRLSDNESCSVIARDMGVSRIVISHIKHKRIYTDITLLP